MIVSNVKSSNGKVESCEFTMSNLTYGGKPTQSKPVKINANNIDKFIDLVESNETISLGITKEQ
ncbi:hypothetical protein KAZ93_01970 [Patescibacteria group bacterium]|nr:hypothetical protein [Patescibacteria group bacterium]